MKKFSIVIAGGGFLPCSAGDETLQVFAVETDLFFRCGAFSLSSQGDGELFSVMEKPQLIAVQSMPARRFALGQEVEDMRNTLLFLLPGLGVITAFGMGNHMILFDKTVSFHGSVLPN